MSKSFLTIALVLLAVPAAAIDIAKINHPGDVDFEKEILPLLRRNCLACHNSTDAESDLILETPQTILKGGSLGPAAVAGKSAESLLLKVAAHSDEPIMPPEDNDVGAKNFTPKELGLLKLWIDQGAKGEVSGGGPVVWQPLPAGVNPIYAVAVTADGRYAAAGRANQIFLYNADAKRELGRLTDPTLLAGDLYNKPGVAHLDLVQSLAFSPDGQLLASGGYRTLKLWRRPLNAKKADLAGLEGAKSVAVSPDGKWAAVGQENGKIQIVDLATGKAAKTLEGHTGAVSGVCFSAAGAKLASGSQDKTCRLWNVADGKELGSIETPAPVNAVALVLKDQQIASAGQDNIIRTWALPGTAKEGEEIKPIKELKGHTGPVTSLQATKQGAQLFSGGDTTGRLWDANGGNMVRQFSHGAAVTSAAARANGDRFVTTSSNNSAKLWDAAGKQLVELKGDPQTKWNSANATLEVTLGKRLVDLAKKDVDEAEKRKKAEEDNGKKAEEAQKKAEEEFKKKEEAAKKPVADKEAADKKLEPVAKQREEKEKAKTAAAEAYTKADEAYKKALAERDAANKKFAAEKDEAKKKEAEKVKAEADKKFADATAQRKTSSDEKKKIDGEFAKLDAEFKKLEAAAKKLDAPAQKATDEKNAAERNLQAAVRSVERSKVSIDKATKAVPEYQAAHKAAEEALKQQEAAQKAAQTQATESEKPWLAAAFSADGKTLATGGDGQQVFTWDADTGAALESFSGQAAAIVLLAFDGAGDVIAIGANNAGVIWDANADWRLERVIGSPDSSTPFVDRITALHFSYDGKLLAVGGGEPSRSGQLHIWNVSDGSLAREIKEPHSDTIFNLEFSRDGKHIASCGADRFMKTFEVETGKFVRSFEGHTHHVLGVSWTADGRTLASSGADKVIKVWNFLTGDQKKTITGFSKEVTSLKFLAVGEDMAASCGDKNVHMKRASGSNIRTLSGGGDYMYSVGVTADGKRIVAGGQDSVLRIWQDNGQAFATFAAPQPEETASAGE